jgi:hypothetical protein
MTTNLGFVSIEDEELSSSTSSNIASSPDPDIVPEFSTVTRNTSTPLVHVEYVMYKRRWIGMFAICMLNISTGLVWLTFNAVPQITSNWLHTGWTQTNLSVILYFAGSIVASTFSGYVFEKWGIKTAVCLSILKTLRLNVIHI